MKRIIPFFAASMVAVSMVAGCGADTMSAAATAAALKKQEVEQGKKTLEQAEKKIGQAMVQTEQRNQQAADIK